MSKSSQLKRNLISALLTATISCAICIAAISIFAKIVLQGKLDYKHIGWIVNVIVAISSMSGSAVSVRRDQRQAQHVSALTPVLLILTMLISSFKVAGGYENVLVRSIAVIVGYAAAYVLCIKKKSKSFIRKKRNR